MIKFIKKKLNSDKNNIDLVIKKIIKKYVHFHFVKSHWHWWQNINKRNTKAVLFFDLWNCNILTDELKDKIIKIAWKKIHHHENILILTSQEERSQHLNKKNVIKKFITIMKSAF